MPLQANFNGKNYIQPTSATKINSSTMNPLQLGYSGVAAVIGSCTSGQPLVPQLFTSPGQLKAALGSGPAYDSARACFSPTSQLVEGNSVRPQIVYVVRTDSATQSVYTANDSNNSNTLTFTSQDWGAQTNSISIAISTLAFTQPTATVVASPGILPVNISITDSYSQAVETYKNVGDFILFSLQYIGTDTAATMTVNSTGLTVNCPTDTASNLNVPFATYATVDQMYNYIAAQITKGLPYVLSNENSNAPYMQANTMDYFTGVSGNVYTNNVPLTAVANAILTTINPVSGTVQVALSTSSTQRPPETVGFTSFSGGSTNSTVSSGNLTAALNALSLTRINFITGAMDADPTLTSFDAGSYFSTFIETMQGSNECRGHLGFSENITLTAAKAYVAQLNCPQITLWFQAPQMNNDQGVTTTYSPWMQAAMACGMQAGMPPGSSFVKKSFNVQGYTWNTSGSGFDIVNNADTILLARISLVRFDQSTSTWNCVRALGAYVSDSNPFNIEPGLQSAVNYAVYEIRKDIENKFLGSRTLFTEAGSTADSIQRELVAFAALLESDNIIVKGTVMVNNQIQTLPALVIDSVTITDDTVRLRYGIRPIGSINFIFHTVSLNPTTQVASA